MDFGGGIEDSALYVSDQELQNIKNLFDDLDL